MKNVGMAIVVILMIGMMCCANSSTEEKNSMQELHGVWYNVYQLNLSNESSAKQTIDEHFKLMKKMGINAIFFLVKSPDGYTYYPGKICPVKTNWDCLDYVIKKSRENAMEIHPYINVYEDSAYCQQNPSVTDLKQTGSTNSWCSPAIKEVNERNLQIITEIAQNYSVDGIQLDRIRYEDGGGYNPRCLKLFKEKYGYEPSDDKMPEWVQFRKDLVTDFVTQAYKTVKSVNPKLKLSVAVFHSPTTSAVRFQDWVKWVENKCVDFVCTMSYTSTQSIFEGYVNDNVTAVGKRNGIPVYIGIGAYYKGMNANILRKQVEYVRKCGLPGVVFFNAYNLFNGRGYSGVLKKM